MKARTETRPTEISMRVLLFVQQWRTRDRDFYMPDACNRVRAEFGLSRATAYRHVRLAMDVLGIHYDAIAMRKKHMSDRLADGHANARLCRSPEVQA